MRQRTSKKGSTPSTSEGTLSTASMLKTGLQSAYFVTRLRLVAVQELNWELTVLHSVKLVKATLQGAGALPGALLHSVRSLGLITC